MHDSFKDVHMAEKTSIDFLQAIRGKTEEVSYLSLQHPKKKK